MSVFTHHLKTLGVAFVAVWLASCTQTPAKIIIHNTTAKVDPSQLRPSQINPFKIKVEHGDTLYNLAKKYDVDIRALIDLNRLRPPYTLTPGESLRLPKATFHFVRPGDTLYSISRNYSVDISSIVRANSLPSPYVIKAGSKLRLPSKTAYEEGLDEDDYQDDLADATPEEAGKLRTVTTKELAPVAVRISRASELKPDRTGNAPKPIFKTEAEDTLPAPLLKPGSQYTTDTFVKRASNSSTPPVKETFSWPVSGGSIISRFGPKKGGLYNDGINISAKDGTSVKAAQSGQVVYAGNELRGYGNLLLIKHDNGYLTAYAHTKENAVKKGQHVTKGQTIAYVGQTGHVSSPQLHFSIRKGRKALNPEKYLSQNLSMLN